MKNIPIQQIIRENQKRTRRLLYTPRWHREADSPHIDIQRCRSDFRY